MTVMRIATRPQSSRTTRSASASSSLPMPPPCRVGDTEKHAEIASAILDGHMGAAEQYVAAFGHQDDALRPCNAGADVVGAGATPAEQVGLGGPPCLLTSPR
jgi:hypothetical protein